MRLNSAIIDGFKRFRFANIRRLEAEFKAPVQLVTGFNGTGKFLANHEPVLTPSGWKPIGDFKVGDEVIAHDGTTTIVNGVFPQGIQQTYKVITNDCRSVLAGLPHLWKAIVIDTETDTKEERVTTTEELISLLKIDKYLIELPRTYGDENTLDKRISEYNNYWGFDKKFFRSELFKLTRENFDTYMNDDRIVISGSITEETREMFQSLGFNIYSNDYNYHLHIYRNRPILITSIEIDKEYECTCISIDHPDKLYITKNYIVTHNSSFLRELSPIPSIRTEYEPGGFKELNISHDKNNFTLTSNFNNRTSPHSFKINGDELNLGGTTDVQTELVEKYFGITPSIRNMMYQKIKMCNTTKSERKNLFLNINPMDLSLLLDVHKNVLGEIRKSKNNLQMLYTRRSDLESKMLSQETLTSHHETRKQMNEQIMEIDKLIYGLDQHISQLRSEFSEDLEYGKRCSENNQPVIPSANIIESCKRIMSEVEQFRPVIRGENFHVEKERVISQRNDLRRQINDIEKHISVLSKEINEYHQHIEKSGGTDVHKLETELVNIRKELTKYTKLTETPLIPNQIANAVEALNSIQDTLHVFSQADVKMIAPEELEFKIRSLETLQNNLAGMKSQMIITNTNIASCKNEIDKHEQSVVLPEICAPTKCSLFNNFNKRIVEVKERHAALIKEFSNKEIEYNKLDAQVKELSEYVQPFVEHKLLERYYFLMRILCSTFPSFDWANTLLDRLSTGPVAIYSFLEEYIKESKLCHERNLLLVKEKELATEIELLMKSDGASLQFLQDNLKTKEKSVAQYLEELKRLDISTSEVDATYNLYLRYSESMNTLLNFKQIYEKGERSLMASRAIKYWEELKTYLTSVKISLSEELRKIESIVREQDVLRGTYNNEILTNIKKIEFDKTYFEKIELAVSPTTGLPHASMVKYLNALISNVNYFISQMWSYRLHIPLLDQDKPLDYGFKIEVGNDVSNDIGLLSDGQQEILNLTWILTVLLQLKMLHTTPLLADELGNFLDETHRLKMIQFLDQLVNKGSIQQMFMVSHHASVLSGFQNCDIINLSPQLPIETNNAVNEYVKIT